MNEWDLLKDMVKTRKELERIRLKYFDKDQNFRNMAEESFIALNESIRMVNKAIEDLTINVTK